MCKFTILYNKTANCYIYGEIYRVATLRSRSVILVAKYTNLVLLKGCTETFLSLDIGLV